MSAVGKWRADAEGAAAKAGTPIPYRSGFCSPGNPKPAHDRCPNGYQGRPCICDCHQEPTHKESPGAAPDAARQGEAHAMPEQQIKGGTDIMLITPTGVLVTDAEPETPEWFAARREGITGTDLPKILGLSKYGNALSVWLDKRGELEDEVGEAALWGQILEDTVAQEWARRNETTVTDVGVIRHIAQPWRRVSLDRLVGDCPDGDGPCALEIKTRSAFVADRWRDGIPDDVLAQTAWGLSVTGLHHHHVACLLGGQRLASYRVERDPKLEKYLFDAAVPVWQAVKEGVPPEAHPDSEGVLLDLLDSLYSKRSGDRQIDAEAARPWLDQYAEGGELEKRGKALKTQAKTALVQMLDDGAAGVIDGAIAFTYRPPEPSPAISAANMRALMESQPEVYEALRADGLITISSPRPRFNLRASQEK